MATQRLAGQTAIVTGAASGIGAAIARRFGAEGAQVLVVDIDEARGRSVAAEIDKAEFCLADVGSSAEVGAMVEAACRRFGQLDVLVNNAFAAASGRVANLSDEDWQRTLRVSLDSVFYGLRVALPRLTAQG